MNCKKCGGVKQPERNKCPDCLLEDLGPEILSWQAEAWFEREHTPIYLLPIPPDENI